MASDPRDTTRKQPPGTLSGLGAVSAEGPPRSRLRGPPADGSKEDSETQGPPSEHAFATDAVGPVSGLSPGMIVAGKFALIRLIAEGGLAQVFEAEDTLVGRRVALKVLHPEFATNPDIVRRFRREAHATAIVDHPNVVTVFEVGRRSDGSLYLVQELLVGPTLHDHRPGNTRLSEDEALRIVTPLASALSTAHGHGVVHRDVKPANIILSRTPFSDMVPKLIDFGVARMQKPRTKGHTMVGTLLGTAQYMSPEQALGEPWVDGRADVWALAVVLYELVTGSCPFDGPNEHAILARVLAEKVTRIPRGAFPIREELADLIHAALERDADRRIGMYDFLVALQALQSQVPSVRSISAMPPPRASQFDDVGPARDSAELRAPRSDGARARALEAQAVLVDLDPDPDESELVTRVSAGTVQADRGASGDWIRGTAEVESDFTRDVTDAAAGGARLADGAQRALQMNALEEAADSAELAIGSGNHDPAVLGQLRLVSAIARYWLGEFNVAEAYARAAMKVLPVRTTGWYAAFGHLVMAHERLGRLDDLDSLVTELGEPPSARLGSAYVIAVSRLAVAMTHAGALTEARQLVRGVRDRIDPNVSTEAVVYAWLDVAFAERAAFVGDPSRELSRRSSALERFTSAGDVRNACQERASLGGVFVRLGSYEEAERVLGEALGIAEPMKLCVAGTIRGQLGYVALQQGDLARAEEHETAALVWARERADRRTEALAMVYLSQIYGLRQDKPLAEARAESAVAAAGAFPAIRAQAFGVRASTCLLLGQADAALDFSIQAIGVLDEFGGAGEAESLIRLTHALALAQTGALDEAKVRIKSARDRIIALAERLADPRHKRSFLERVPENARILRLATEWHAES